MVIRGLTELSSSVSLGCGRARREDVVNKRWRVTAKDLQTNPGRTARGCLAEDINWLFARRLPSEVQHLKFCMLLAWPTLGRWLRKEEKKKASKSCGKQVSSEEAGPTCENTRKREGSEVKLAQQAEHRQRTGRGPDDGLGPGEQSRSTRRKCRPSYQHHTTHTLQGG